MGSRVSLLGSLRAGLLQKSRYGLLATDCLQSQKSTMKQPLMASSSCAAEADVKKKGYLLKVKVNNNNNNSKFIYFFVEHLKHAESASSERKRRS